VALPELACSHGLCVRRHYRPLIRNFGPLRNSRPRDSSRSKLSKCLDANSRVSQAQQKVVPNMQEDVKSFVSESDQRQFTGVRNIISCHILARRYTRLFANAALFALVAASAAQAQDIEPRKWSNAPVGVNFLILGYAYTQGGVASDPALPVTNPHLETNSGALGFARSLDLWGFSGKLDVSVPYTWLSGSADYQGRTVQRTVNGFGDPEFELSVNLYGAPAMGLKDFTSYKQDWIVGVGLKISAPSGQYDDTRLVNIATHRWFFRPSFGVSKAIGRWTLESTAEATFYTDNTDFYGGTTRSQAPLYSIQGHVIHSFPNGIWASVDATYFVGGRTAINGTESNNLQQNWRAGATLALPINARNSIKLYASDGVSARTGDSFKLYGVAWQYRWGGGI
jgi:hypothetical protein